MARWNQRQAESLIGKYVLVGLTFKNADGRVVDQVQRHGTVEQVDPEAGVQIRLQSPGNAWDRELYWLPPDLRSFEPAEPGSTYHLHSTGEDVEDPDFTSSWTIAAPNAEDDTPETRDARHDEARRLGFRIE
jgi:hypothetical protein